MRMRKNLHFPVAACLLSLAAIAASAQQDAGAFHAGGSTSWRAGTSATTAARGDFSTPDASWGRGMNTASTAGWGRGFASAANAPVAAANPSAASSFRSTTPMATHRFFGVATPHTSAPPQQQASTPVSTPVRSSPSGLRAAQSHSGVTSKIGFQAPLGGMRPGTGLKSSHSPKSATPGRVLVKPSF